MTVRSIRLLPALLTVSLIWVPNITAQQPSAGSEESTIKQVVDSYMQPFLTQHDIPGAVVGVSIKGRRYFFNYGKATDQG
jgi:hypothetical protein